MIHTNQGAALPDRYMPLLQFLSQGMKDREAVEIVYKLQAFIEKREDNDKLVSLIEALR